MEMLVMSMMISLSLVFCPTVAVETNHVEHFYTGMVSESAIQGKTEKNAKLNGFDRFA